MKRTVPNVGTKEYAFPAIKITAYDASVTMVSQENLAVSLGYIFLGKNSKLKINVKIMSPSV